jgi:hypothetical protein
MLLCTLSMHREKARFGAPWDWGRVLINVSVFSSYLKVDFFEFAYLK